MEAAKTQIRTWGVLTDLLIFSSPRQSPGRAIVLPPAAALANIKLEWSRFKYHVLDCVYSEGCRERAAKFNLMNW